MYSGAAPLRRYGREIEKFAAGAINDEAPSRLATLQDGRNSAIADLRIQKNRLTGRIILAVRGLLEEPAQHAGLCIERCDAVGVEIVAGADEIDVAGSRIADADKDEA